MHNKYCHLIFPERCKIMWKYNAKILNLYSRLLFTYKKFWLQRHTKLLSHCFKVVEIPSLLIFHRLMERHGAAPCLNFLEEASWYINTGERNVGFSPYHRYHAHFQQVWFFLIFQCREMFDLTNAQWIYCKVDHYPLGWVLCFKIDEFKKSLWKNR